MRRQWVIQWVMRRQWVISLRHVQLFWAIRFEPVYRPHRFRRDFLRLPRLDLSSLNPIQLAHP